MFYYILIFLFIISLIKFCLLNKLFFFLLLKIILLIHIHCSLFCFLFRWGHYGHVVSTAWLKICHEFFFVGLMVAVISLESLNTQIIIPILSHRNPLTRTTTLPPAAMMPAAHWLLILTLCTALWHRVWLHRFGLFVLARKDAENYFLLSSLSWSWISKRTPGG